MRALICFLGGCFGPALCLAAEPVDVLAVEYPPFTSRAESNGGLAFSMLQAAYPDLSFKPLWVPPKRAYQMMQNNQWCMSFYPAPEGITAQKIQLSTNQVTIGLIRLRKPEPFSWHDLIELQGNTIAVLRTGKNSKFARQFLDVGIQLIETETIQQAAELVLLQRVNIAIFDNFNFSHLPPETREKLQFSATYLLQMPISIYTNPNCQQQLSAPSALRNF